MSILNFTQDYFTSNNAEKHVLYQDPFMEVAMFATLQEAISVIARPLE